MTLFTMESAKKHRVPKGSMTLWWLGQSGFLVKSPAGKIAAIDPYLSNSCKAVGDAHGFNMDRLVPPPLAPEDLVGIDLYAITHSHQDHLDPETLGPYRKAGGCGPYLAPAETAEKLVSLGVPEDQVVMMWPNKSTTLEDLTFRATFAIPLGGDDLTHVGYLASIKDGPKAYFTGDTAYHDLLAASVGDHKPDIMATVINGAFRNMSPAEAALLTKQIDPAVVIPCHYDLFPDNLQPPQMLRTNLHILGIGEKYRLLEHGVPYTFPEQAS